MRRENENLAVKRCIAKSSHEFHSGHSGHVVVGDEQIEHAWFGAEPGERRFAVVHDFDFVIIAVQGERDRERDRPLVFREQDVKGRGIHMRANSQSYENTNERTIRKPHLCGRPQSTFFATLWRGLTRDIWSERCPNAGQSGPYSRATRGKGRHRPLASSTNRKRQLESHSGNCDTSKAIPGMLLEGIAGRIGVREEKGGAEWHPWNAPVSPGIGEKMFAFKCEYSSNSH